LHYQATAIPQGHGDFHSPYASSNSLSPETEVATSFTSTLYVGRKLWNGAEVYINPEILAGSGLSHTLGIAGFPNGEIYRVDNPRPKLNLSRFFLRQTWGRGDSGGFVPSGQNHVPGYLFASRISLTAGKFSLVDMFDGNAYSHDARTQFMNWPLMDNGAWDFAADTRGYTEGVALEVYRSRWAWRMASVLVPKYANGMQMDTRIARAQADNFEVERRHALHGHAGAARLMTYANHAHMGSYCETIDTPPFEMDIAKSRAYRAKYGAGVNLEQEIAKDLGVFFRYGWNDGHTETWAFTEIDRTGSGGLSLGGRPWGRPSDRIGLAFVENGLSHDHEEYLSLGGKGFIIGDGKLNYGRERILETYYLIALKDGFALSPDFQYVVSPAYNRDRGPVTIYALRLHWER
jgi:high affinity Mn2+ porin